MLLAEAIGSGMTTFPPDRAALEEKISASIDGFANPSESGAATYLLVAKHSDQKAVLGCSAVYSRIGQDYGFYSYKLCRTEQRSVELERTHALTHLNPVNDLTGWSEVGSLVVDPRLRQSGLGRQLAKSRYVLIGQHPARFGENIFAELRGWQSQEGISPFWDAVGRKFFGLSFDDADRFSAVRGSKFIYDLLPRLPISVDLLPSDARHAVGRAHETSAYALKLLIAEGFRYDGYVDVFDAGPQVCASAVNIRTVRDAQVLPVAANACDDSKRYDDAMLGTTRLDDFRVAVGSARIEDGRVYISENLRRALDLTTDDRVCVSHSHSAKQPLSSTFDLANIT